MGVDHNRECFHRGLKDDEDFWYVAACCPIPYWRICKLTINRASYNHSSPLSFGDMIFLITLVSESAATFAL